ncbi:MAG: glutamate--tRNA ligase family protein [Bacilli bacterium]
MFPDIQETLEDLERRYPERDLPKGAEVTRFAPSPTGFLHTGSLFASLIAQTFAHQSGGIFFVRLEDTDTKREIVGSDLALIEQMAAFGVAPDEGFGAREPGRHGPYRQSERARIYKTVIKELVRRGDAYPCFASTEELDELRKYQESRKILTGYYGSFAKYRDYPVEKAVSDIESGRPYVVRFRSQGDHNCYIKVRDEIRGSLSLSQNDQDIVILKSDGLPTYHFAHVVDDHFMRTTLVSRGEEWVASLPIHIEMFARLGFNTPRFAHLPVIMKLDEGKKRKLSKRRDVEAAVSFFLEHGYPVAAVIEYLFTIANSNFEEWRLLNKTASLTDFKLTFEKMSLDGALFDMAKVVFISKEVLAAKSAQELLTETRAYAMSYHPGLLDLIDRDPEYFKAIVNIEREKENPRKDYSSYESIYEFIKYFYRDHYETSLDLTRLNPAVPVATVRSLLWALSTRMAFESDEPAWFEGFKAIAGEYGFAPSGKIFKQNPDLYIGHIGDAAEILRLALTGLKQTPNLFQIMKVLGRPEVVSRLEFVIDKLPQK